MILDQLSNASLYTNLHPRIARGLEYLQALQLTHFVDKREEIDGSDLFALYQAYETKAPETGVWESHHRYADIQYIVSGAERMDVCHVSTLGAPDSVSEERDLLLYKTPADEHETRLYVPAGSFAIFLPEDAHRPNLFTDGAPAAVQKIVIKVRL